MEKKLNYFSIDGKFGGSQAWFKDIFLRKGGCAAIAACDCCIYLTKEHGMTELYPYDIHHLTIPDYLAFGRKMKPYLHPRLQGITKLKTFRKGFGAYLKKVEKTHPDMKIHLSGEMEECPGTAPFETARDFLKNQLDQGLPVPYLMLRHQNKKKYGGFEWHWFMIVGYREIRQNKKEAFWVQAATYANEYWLNLEELWDTGKEPKGGMIGLKTLNY